jgi:predicted MFS family arabinose efflux permease
MEKLFKLIDHKRTQVVPLIVTCVCVLVGYMIAYTWIGERMCGGDGCDGAIGIPLFLFSTLFFPGALSLLFMRKEIFHFWYLFSSLYIVVSLFLLLMRSAGGWINNRAIVAGELGLGLSIITIFWVITHLFIIHAREKRK